MPLTSYSTTTYYDAGLDGYAVCFVGYTGRGSYWIKVLKAPEGRKRRDQEKELLARLAVAVAKGQPPGEVSMSDPRPERLDDQSYDDGEF